MSTPLQQRIERLRQLAVTGMFAVFLVVPAVGMLLPGRPAARLVEKRRLAELPGAPRSAAEWTAYPAAFERYFNDHFGFRTPLTQTYNELLFDVARVSPAENVILGDGEWLFYWAAEGRRTFQRTSPFTGTQLANWRTALLTLRDYLASRGTDLLVVIAPSKSRIYPEHVPARYRRSAHPSRTEQFVNMARQSDIPIVDLAPTLRRARDRMPAYLVRDSHWTSEGAFEAYLAIMEALKTMRPELQPARKSEMGRRTWPDRPGDLGHMLGLRRPLTESTTVLEMPEALAASIEIQRRGSTDEDEAATTVYRHTDAGRPRLLLYHDSFSFALMPFLAMHFDTTAHWSYRVRKAEVEQREPDVLILEIIDRALEDSGVPLGDQADISNYAHRLEDIMDLPYHTGRNLQCADSMFGHIRRAEQGRDPAGWVLFGGYRELAAGSYRAVLRSRWSGTPGASVARVDVTSDYGRNRLAATDLRAGTGTTGEWQEVEMRFACPAAGSQGIEIRAEFLGAGRLEIDSLLVEPVSSLVPSP